MNHPNAVKEIRRILLQQLGGQIAKYSEEAPTKLSRVCNEPHGHLSWRRPTNDRATDGCMCVSKILFRLWKQEQILHPGDIPIDRFSNREPCRNRRKFLAIEKLFFDLR
jgi:hypothetical protein